MNKELKVVLESMTNSEIADYVLTMTCKTLAETKETDVIEVIKHCLGFCDYLKHEGEFSSTRIFNVYEIIIRRVKKVVGDGGIVIISCEKI
ncbi:hypothetical protein KTC96_24915 (plasmid) [Clostridium estertheticum]|uniref:hypothetical protein n=1 Tax=Clostridium estertheticum TaxID=238834 RepID=UPI001C7E0DE5|nr:hypothetical protein [Clostridium estertheticum]MBX4259771.1 hypothetical protein [Clostridium estertheticum]WLC73264.1 hypothetical protein KTC96_24915 [Clostridium estertheticum]